MAEAARRRRFGDRRDGRKLRSLDATYKIAPFIMKARTDACSSFSDSVEVSATDRWLRAKRADGYKGMGMLHLFAASYVRSVAMLPAANRFVSGQTVFARHDIQVILKLKTESAPDSRETAVKVGLAPEDTVFDVYRKLGAAVDDISASEADGKADRLAGALCSLPRLLLKFVIWALGALDYFDLLPASVIKASPYHGSVVITDAGSLGIPPVHHNLCSFGNLPLHLSFGARRGVIELDSHTQASERMYIDFAAVSDGRAADEAAYANAFKYIKYFIRNPAILEQPPGRVEEDVF